MNVFTIKHLENLSGIRAHTIRVWEQRYNFLKPGRTDTNIRYYSSHELKTVLNISLLNRFGYKISHIDRMSEAEIQDKLITLSDNDARQERLVNELIVLMIDLQIEAFEQTLDAFILTRGIDRGITEVLFPFLNRIGILWLTHQIHPAQEHLVSNVIRQKLIVGIEATLTRRRPGKTVVLFLPEGEHHELGLLYVYYLLKIHGANVLYLGADVPQSDLEFLCQARRPDYLYTHLTGIASNFQLDKFLAQVTRRIDIPLVISGELARNQLRKIPAGVNFRRDIGEVLDFVGTL